MTAYSSVSPDVEIDLGVEVRQHDHGNEAEDEALAPVDVGGVGRVQAEGGHVKEHAGHVHAVHLSKDEQEVTRIYLSVFTDLQYNSYRSFKSGSWCLSYSFQEIKMSKGREFPNCSALLAWWKIWQ